MNSAIGGANRGAGPRPDFDVETFLDLARPHLVTDPSRLPLLPAFGDGSLDPTLSPPRSGLRDAAVLVPVVAHPGEAGVILTLRTAHLAAHAGQVAFPGGKIDPEDTDAIATALREAQEEIGLDPVHVVPIGCFAPYASNSGYRIVPVLGVVRPGLTLEPNPDEVAGVFEVPLSFLMDGGNHRVSHREWQGRRRYFYEMPFGERHIWGVTAGIIRQIFERTYGVGAPPAPGTPERSVNGSEP
ncbi:CoA pyrophosphatase [Siculibacillus lacustris]|uniref:CoA pyrophosphatase n=1 Tax=Siculibacillus lacustris TaxID=1549641 RepID=A0A4Q9VP17_9HYPH|nr:CoA pyrophosphatase [Siculibacillus lacustris]TBW37428.1 CoA pyrophosphatase [Siculibacillus lacustris]